MIVVVCMLPLITFAEGRLEEQAAMLQTQTLTDSLPADARDLVGDFSLSTGTEFGQEFISIVKKAVHGHSLGFDAAVKDGKKILWVVLFSAVGFAVSEGPTARVISVAAVGTLFIITSSGLNSLVSLGMAAAEDLRVFSQSLLPVMASAAAASGIPAASAAMYAVSTAFLSGLVSLMNALLIPLIRAHLVLGAADAALDIALFSSLKKFVEAFIKMTLKLSMFGFTAFLLLTGVVSGSADAISVKAAKLAISSVVPVVGSMISDASETVLVGAKVLLQSVGIFGMLGALSVLILPFLKIGLRYLMMKISVFLSMAFQTEKVSSFLADVEKTVAFVLAVICCCGLFVFVSCVCFLRVGTP